MKEFEKTPMNTLKSLQELIADVRKNVDMIYSPTFVVQARHDHMINTESANIIYNEVETDDKQLKWYEAPSFPFQSAPAVFLRIFYNCARRKELLRT